MQVGRQESNWWQVLESLLEIVGSTILKEIVGSIIGTKSAKVLFIWNTFNNRPADSQWRPGKLKLQVFAIFERFSSFFSDQERERFKESHIAFQMQTRVPFWQESFEEGEHNRNLKKAGRVLQRDPAAFPPDPTTVKFICKTFQSVEQEDKYRADKKVS